MGYEQGRFDNPYFRQKSLKTSNCLHLGQKQGQFLGSIAVVGNT